MTVSSDAAGGGSARLPAAGLLLLVGLTIVWGLNWPVMKIALVELPVWWFRSACAILGGFALVAVSVAAGGPLLPRRRDVPPLLLCGLFSIVAWQILMTYGVALMPAGRAAIVAYTMPVWAALFGFVMLGERLTANLIVGLVLGLAGLAVLIGPDLVVLSRAPVGAAAMLAAAMAWAFGTVLFKRTAWSTPVSTTVGWQLLAGAVPITLGAMLLETPPDVAALKVETWLAFAFVIVLAMSFGQWAYFRIVKLMPASVAATSTLAVPVVGVYSSMLMLGERVGVSELAALALICAALFAVLVLPAVRAGRSKRS